MMTTLLAVGATAPDFTLPASDGYEYHLAELLQRGSAVLIFYPGNNTPG